MQPAHHLIFRRRLALHAIDGGQFGHHALLEHLDLAPSCAEISDCQSIASLCACASSGALRTKVPLARSRSSRPSCSSRPERLAHGAARHREFGRQFVDIGNAAADRPFAGGDAVAEQGGELDIARDRAAAEIGRDRDRPQRASGHGHRNALPFAGPIETTRQYSANPSRRSIKSARRSCTAWHRPGAFSQ